MDESGDSEVIWKHALTMNQVLLNTSPFSKQRAKDQEGTKALYTKCADVRKQACLLGILSKVIFVNVYI